MAPLTRRRFLQTATAWAGGLTVLGGLAPGAVQHALAASIKGPWPPRRYVFCYFAGGWDLLLGLDPRSPRAFPRARTPQTLIELGYEAAQGVGDELITPIPGMSFGPAIGELADHADKLALVRGLSMETLEHERARRRFLTGIADPAPSGAPQSAPTDRLAAQQALLPADVTGGPLSPAPDPRDADPRDADPGDANASGEALGRTLTQADLRPLIDLADTSERMSRLRDHFGILGPGSGGPGTAAALAAEAITRAYSRVVLVDIQSDLDTHEADWARHHGLRLRAGFNAVARLLTWLQREPYLDTGSSWLDHTVVIGFSEFGRSAVLNRQGGRDHSLSNACFLAGGPVVGGTVFGRTDDLGMLPTTVSLRTGAHDPAGEILRPEHLLQTLLMDAGLDRDPSLHAAPLSGLLKPG